MHPYPTISAIVDCILQTWSQEDLDFVKSGIQDFGQIGRHIRNDFGLWYDHPLTEKWRNNEAGRTIIDGIDHSSDHPDAVAALVVEELRKRIGEPSEEARADLEDLRKRVDALLSGGPEL